MPPLTTISGVRQYLIKQCNGRIKRRIGILGGSFNPVHQGHLHLSHQALKHLHLDQVWWVIAKQNPLKPTEGMAPFVERLRVARGYVQHEKNIIVTDIEGQAGWKYSYIGLGYFCRTFPDTRFVLVLGSDLVDGLHHWHRWQQIIKTLPLAIFARAARRFLQSCSFVSHYRRFRLKPRSGYIITKRKTPCWVYIPAKQDATSATMLRQQGYWKHKSKNTKKRPSFE